MGYYEDLWKQIQSRDTQLPTQEPPAEEPEAEGLGNTLSRWSQQIQENYNIGKLAEPESYPAGFGGYSRLFKPLAAGAEAAGKAIGAIPAAAGAGLFTPPILDPRGLTFEQKLAATQEGMQEGGTKAREMLTPLDLASMVPGPVGIAAGAADVALGAGDIYGGVKEGSVSRTGMGVARVAGNLLGIHGELGKLRSTGKPKVDAAAAAAQATETPSALTPPPVRTGGEDEFFTGTATPRRPSENITPQAQDVLRVAAQNALMESNRILAAEGQATPVQKIVFADPATGLAQGPFGPFKIPSTAFVSGDTIYISRVGQGSLLQADDAAGVVDRVVDVMTHETGHPAREAWRGETPGSKQTETGHFEGALKDDRTADLDQIMHDWKLATQVKASPAMKRLAAHIGENKMLDGAFQGSTGLSATAGTYTPDLLQLAHELTGRPAPSLYETSRFPRHPEVEVQVQGQPGAPAPTPKVPRVEGPVSLLQPPPEFTGKASGGGARDLPDAEEIPILPDDAVSLVEAGPVMRALTGRQPKAPRVIDVQADAPTVWSFLRRTEAGESTRGLDAVKALEELEGLSKAKKLGQGTLERVGVPLGGLWPIRNRLNQTIRRVYGADSPRGIELQTRLNKIAKVHPRAFRQSSRFFEQPEAAMRLEDKSLRRAQPMFRQTPREAGKLDKLSATLEKTKALEGADATTRERAKAALAEVIREGNLMPPKTEPERLARTMGAFGSALTRLRKALSSLGPKERVAAVDRAVQGEGRTRLAAWRLEEEARIAKKAEAATKTEGPRLAPPPKGKAAGGGFREFEGPKQGQKVEPESGFRRLLQAAVARRESLSKSITGERFKQLLQEAKAERAKPSPKRPSIAAPSKAVHAKLKEASAAIPIGRAFPLKGETAPRVGIERGAERVKVPVWKLLDELKLRSQKAKAAGKKFWESGGPAVVRKKLKKTEPLHPQLLAEATDEFGKRLRETKQTLTAKPRIRAALEGVTSPKETREFKPGVSTRGKFKVEPTKYRTDKLSKRVAAGANEPAPLYRVAAERERDATAFDRLENWLYENMVIRRTGKPITPELIESSGFTLRTKESMKRNLAEAARGASPEEALRKFSKSIDEQRSFLGIEGKKTAELHVKSLRKAALKNPSSLMKDVAAKWKEGKISPFINRKGPFGARKDKPVLTRTLEAKDGTSIKDPIGGAKQIARLASDTLGREVSVEDVLAAGETSARPKGLTQVVEESKGGVTPTLNLGKELSGPEAGKARLLGGGAKTQKNLYSLADVVKHYVEKQDFAPELLEHPAYANVAEKQPASSYEYTRERAPMGGFEYATKGNQKSAGGVPESLQPLQPGKVQPTGKRPKRFDENVPAGMKTSKVGLSDFFTKAEDEAGANPFEKPSINLPSPALDPVTVKEVLGNTPLPGEYTAVQRSVKEGMEGLKSLIDQLHEKGRLKDKAYAEKMAKEKYDVPEVLEELSYSSQMKRDIDPETASEMWVNWDKVTEFKKSLAEKARQDFREEYRAGKEKVLEKRLEEKKSALTLQEKRAGLEDLPLSAKTSAFLKASTPPKLLGDIAKWVDTKVKTGDVPVGQRNRAVELLRKKAQRAEEWAARKSKYPTKVSEKDMVLYGKAAGGGLRTPPPLPKDVAENIEKISMARGLLKDPTQSTQKGWDTLHKMLEYGNVTRPLMTAVDVSNPLRQTAQLSFDQIARDGMRLLTNPRAKVDVSFRKNIVNMLKVFGSKERAEVAMKWVTEHPEFKEAQRLGMRFIAGGPQHESWLGKTALDKAFDNLGPLGKAPKWLVDGSERSFKWYQDKAMLDAYRFGKEWMYQRAQDLKTDFTTEDLRTMVGHINEAASRSKVLKDKDWERALGGIFFSAQMTKSRAAQLGKALIGYSSYATPLSKSYGRHQMLRAIAGGAALTGGVFTTAALAGLKPELETDMRSTDFGKVKIGNITWDGGAGYFQFLRVTAQLISGQQKTRGTGEIKPRSVGDTLYNFVRSKLAPGPGMLITAKEKRTFMGEPFNVKQDPVGAAQILARDMLMPMSVRDVDEVIKENPRVAWLLPLMLLGTGVTSDVPSQSKWRTAGRLSSLKELAIGQQDRSVQLRERELANRQEFKKRKISPPNLTAGQITLPARDKLGMLKKYSLTPQEKEAFVSEYMPLVTDLLNEFINSNTYLNLPEDAKKRALYNRVHYLNQAYGTNTRARAKYIRKFQEGTLDVKEEE